MILSRVFDLERNTTGTIHAATEERSKVSKWTAKQSPYVQLDIHTGKSTLKDSPSGFLLGCLCSISGHQRLTTRPLDHGRLLKKDECLGHVYLVSKMQSCWEGTPIYGKTAKEKRDGQKEQNDRTLGNGSLLLATILVGVS